MFKNALSAVALCLIAATAQAGDIVSSVNSDELPRKKRTTLGLYLTPGDAHAALQKYPGVVFVDVRDPVEISFVGHASGVDAIVPIATVTHRYNAKSSGYEMIPNKKFLQQVEAIVAREGGDKASPIFLICRSGARSAAAAQRLIAAGYANVWNLIEGFEGDKDKATGTRIVNGWRNAGLPWTYKISTTVAWRGEKRK